MSRINTNISSLQAIHRLNRNNSDLSTRLERLSSGLKINSGKDAPAALIASETLRSEITGINQAITNSERAGNVINTAEGALGQVSALLLEVQSLTNEAANSGALSSEEVAANQLQVDSILSSLNRIANTTQFNGVKLLNGALDYTVENDTNVSNVHVNAARLPDGADVGVVISVTQSAQTGVLRRTASAALTDAITLEVGGSSGKEQLSFAAATTNTQIAAAINAVKTATGVSAALSGGALRVDSIAFGSEEYVTLSVVSGTSFTPSGSADFGRDATVAVNGAAASVKGLAVSYRSSNLDVEFDLSSAANTNAGAADFDITGGGATFALGSKVTETDKASLGIKSVSTGSLGDATDGFLSSLGSGGANALSSDNLVKSQRIIDRSIKQVAQLRGRLGAFQKEVLESNINSLSVALENVTASESAIRDADFAEETAALTRAQILVQANTSVLAQANASPQNVLALLQG